MRISITTEADDDQLRAEIEVEGRVATATDLRRLRHALAGLERLLMAMWLVDDLEDAGEYADVRSLSDPPVDDGD